MVRVFTGDNQLMFLSHIDVRLSLSLSTSPVEILSTGERILLEARKPLPSSLSKKPPISISLGDNLKNTLKKIDSSELK